MACLSFDQQSDAACDIASVYGNSCLLKDAHDANSSVSCHIKCIQVRHRQKGLVLCQLEKRLQKKSKKIMQLLMQQREEIQAGLDQTEPRKRK